MPKVGPFTTLKLSFEITYSIRGREVSTRFGPVSITYDDPAVPAELWRLLDGSEVGSEIEHRPDEPLPMAGGLGHELVTIDPEQLGDDVKVGDELMIEDGAEPTRMTIVSITDEQIVASENPFALDPVVALLVQVESVEGGLVVDGSQLAPESRATLRGLTLAGQRPELRFLHRTSQGQHDARVRMARSGNLALTGAGLAVNDGTNSGVQRGLWLWKPGDSNHVIYSANTRGKSPAGKPATGGFFGGSHRMRFRTYTGQGFLFENQREAALVDIDADDGRLWTKGAIYCGGSDLYFTETDHAHTAVGNKPGYAAIENAKNYQALMILGRTVTRNPLRRVVKLWDELTVHGTLRHRRIAQLSDESQKKNIAELEPGLEEIRRLRPVSFEWTDAPNPTKTYGLLAQQTRDVLPEVVEEDPDSGQLGVATPELVAVLVKAVQDLTRKVEALEARVVELEGKA